MASPKYNISSRIDMRDLRPVQRNQRPLVLDDFGEFAPNNVLMLRPKPSLLRRVIQTLGSDIVVSREENR